MLFFYLFVFRSIRGGRRFVIVCLLLKGIVLFCIYRDLSWRRGSVGGVKKWSSKVLISRNLGGLVFKYFWKWLEKWL